MLLGEVVELGAGHVELGNGVARHRINPMCGESGLPPSPN
jgi:hypothetical protein